MKLAEHFSDFMAIARHSRNLTQVEVVKMTGLTRSTLSIMESRAENVTLENVGKFLSGMGLKLEDFLDYYNNHARKENGVVKGRL